MRVYVVIDTNVLVAAMLTRHKDSSTNRIINAVTNLKITPLYHKDILKEYREVLSREKFCFDPYDVNRMIDVITSYGIPTNREPSTKSLPTKMMWSSMRLPCQKKVPISLLEI